MLTLIVVTAIVLVIVVIVAIIARRGAKNEKADWSAEDILRREG